MHSPFENKTLLVIYLNECSESVAVNLHNSLTLTVIVFFKFKDQI